MSMKYFLQVYKEQKKDKIIYLPTHTFMGKVTKGGNKQFFKDATLPVNCN